MKREGLGRSSVLVILVGLALVGAVLGGERAHTVRPGESASAIAMHYYGSYEPTDLLLRHNGLVGTTIHDGETLRVPFAEVHRVREGDTWSGLARDHLGRASHYPVLARLNGRPEEAPLIVGTTIVLPFVVTHRLARGETLGGLATTYYGDSSLGQILAGFNVIEDPRRLSVGHELRIPLVAPRLAKPKRAQPSAAAPPAPPDPVETRAVSDDAASRAAAERFDSRMTRAERAFDEGEYDEARGLLESLREHVDTQGAGPEGVRFARLLAFVHVAFDEEPEACTTYAGLADSGAAPPLDPDYVSPKIRDVLARCPD